MKLPASAGSKLLPIPISVLLTLLWVGVVRLFFMFVIARAQSGPNGDVWLAVLLAKPVAGRGSLPTVIVGISFLLVVYLWLDYRSRSPSGWRAFVYLAAAALLAYLGWAVWFFWWGQLDVLTQPVDVLMTSVSLTVGTSAG